MLQIVNTKNIKLGAILRVNLGLVGEHSGIYIGKGMYMSFEKDGDSPIVGLGYIHEFSGKSDKPGVIHVEDLEKDNIQRVVRAKVIGAMFESKFSPEKKEKIVYPMKMYNPMTHNCHRFVSYCVNPKKSINSISMADVSELLPNDKWNVFEIDKHYLDITKTKSILETGGNFDYVLNFKKFDIHARNVNKYFNTEAGMPTTVIHSCRSIWVNTTFVKPKKLKVDDNTAYAVQLSMIRLHPLDENRPERGHINYMMYAMNRETNTFYQNVKESIIESVSMIFRVNSTRAPAYI